MDPITIEFEVEEGVDANALTQAVADQLAHLDAVEESQVAVPDERFGVAEAVAIISGVVLLTKSAREGLEELKKFLESLREVVAEVKGLKGAVLDIAGKRVALDQPEEVLAALQEE